MIDFDDLTKIQLDLMLRPNEPPRVTGPEADAMREKLKADIEAIHAKGGVVDIPFGLCVDIEPAKPKNDC